MNDVIKIKGGDGYTPLLQNRELGYNRAEKALYIGTPDGNERLCSPNDRGVFYATYGVTTGEKIRFEYQNGKIIACKISEGRILYLVNASGNVFTFSATYNSNVITVSVEGNEWSEISTQQFATKNYIDGLIETIKSRLDDLEGASE